MKPVIPPGRESSRRTVDDETCRVEQISWMLRRAGRSLSSFLSSSSGSIGLHHVEVQAIYPSHFDGEELADVDEIVDMILVAAESVSCFENRTKGDN
jgi:hypothetical protein